VRYDKFVLSLATEGAARRLVNKDPRTRFERVELSGRASGRQDFLAEFPIECLVLNGDVDTTALVLERFEWGDERNGRFWFDVSGGQFVARVCSAGGKRLIDTASNRTAIQLAKPNPAVDGTELTYSLREDGLTSLALYDLSGKLVKQLFSVEHLAGTYSYWAELHDVPTGAYFLVLQTPKERTNARMEVIR
jgi:hypothetical protein